MFWVILNLNFKKLSNFWRVVFFRCIILGKRIRKIFKYTYFQNLIMNQYWKRNDLHVTVVEKLIETKTVIEIFQELENQLKPQP